MIRHSSWLALAASAALEAACGGNDPEASAAATPGEYGMRYIHVGADGRAVKARQEITVE
ncbi:MAG: hypothetical protein AAFR33_15795 [Pseudomonadota bacterium]